MPPDVEHPLFDPLELTDAQSDWLGEKRSSNSGEDSGHQIGSYASAVQDTDMEMECQPVSNGISVGDTSGYHDHRVTSLKAGAADWRLLLQIDSDDDLGLMWGDLGTVYFRIREQDARAGDFSRTWMILQCH